MLRNLMLRTPMLRRAPDAKEVAETEKPAEAAAEEVGSTS